MGDQPSQDESTWDTETAFASVERRDKQETFSLGVKRGETLGLGIRYNLLT